MRLGNIFKKLSSSVSYNILLKNRKFKKFEKMIMSITTEFSEERTSRYFENCQFIIPQEVNNT